MFPFFSRCLDGCLLTRAGQYDPVEARKKFPKIFIIFHDEFMRKSKVENIYRNLVVVWWAELMEQLSLSAFEWISGGRSKVKT